jgi:GT2 family glycosyltransferase
VIDNASPDDTVMKLKEQLPFVTIIKNKKNSGYAGAINIGMSLCQSEFAVISNNDVIYRSRVLDGLLNVAKKNDAIAVAGPAQVYADGSWQISYGDFPGLKLAIKHLFLFEAVGSVFKKFIKTANNEKNSVRQVEYVDGAVMLVRKSVFDELGGFDEDFDFYSEEADFCYRVRQVGFSVVSDQGLTVTHLRGGANNHGNLKTENIFKLVKSKVLFCKKHYTEKQTKLCSKIEKLYALLYSGITSLLSHLVTGNIKKKLIDKSIVMHDFYRAWSESYKDYYE